MNEVSEDANGSHQDVRRTWQVFLDRTACLGFIATLGFLMWLVGVDDGLWASSPGTRRALRPVWLEISFYVLRASQICGLLWIGIELVRKRAFWSTLWRVLAKGLFVVSVFSVASVFMAFQVRYVAHHLLRVDDETYGLVRAEAPMLQDPVIEIGRKIRSGFWIDEFEVVSQDTTFDCDWPAKSAIVAEGEPYHLQIEPGGRVIWLLTDRTIVGWERHNCMKVTHELNP